MSTVGVSVIERESADANRVVPSDIFAVGMVCTARRGPINTAIPVYNPMEDKRVFGEYSTAFLSGYVRRGLFENCAEFGAKVYVVRIAKSDAVTAFKTFKDSAVADTWTFKSGVLGLDSPGIDGNNTSVQLVASLGDATKRDVLVYYKGPHDSAPVLKETFEFLDNSNVVDVINRKSMYVRAALVGSSLPPTVIARTDLATGADGVAAISDGSYTAGLAFLNGLAVPMILSVDVQTAAAATALETYVDSRGDAIGIINSALSESAATMTTAYAALLKTKSNLVAYRGWGRVDSEFGGLVWVPLLGHAVGAAWIRKCMERGGFPWVAPAGPDTALRGVVEMDTPMYSEGELDTMVHTIGFNPVQFVPGKGFIVRTSRTFSTMRKYYSAHVRRMTHFFRATFRNSFSWIEQEPNTERTRRRIADSLTFFAQDCYSNGAFATRNGYANNVKIKCDEENNTPTMEDSGQLAADFVFHPVEAIEAATINIFQTRDSLQITDK